MKDSTPFEEQHDIVYHSFRSAENCNEDRNFHLFKHSVESRRDPVLKNDFRIIGKGYRNNTCGRKIAEAVFLRRSFIHCFCNHHDYQILDYHV